jgi:DNA polymerase/3'-5' exonuclease PolX
MSPMPLEYAQSIAEHLVKRLTPHLQRVVVAGSVRRETPNVGDLEIVGEPYLNADLFDEGGTPILEGLRAELLTIGRFVKNGNRYMRVHFPKPDVYADIFLVSPPAQWGSILAIRTGPSTLSKHVVTKMRENGYVHTDGYAKNADTGEVVPTETEEQFFALAGLACPIPRNRDHLAKLVGK